MLTGLNLCKFEYQQWHLVHYVQYYVQNVGTEDYHYCQPVTKCAALMANITETTVNASMCPDCCLLTENNRYTRSTITYKTNYEQ